MHLKCNSVEALLAAGADVNVSDKEYDANAAFAIVRKYVPSPGLNIEGTFPTAQKRLQQLKQRASHESRGHGD